MERRNPSKGTIAACVLAGTLGLTLAVSAIVSMRRELNEDERIAADLIDERSPEELEVDLLLRETERLEAEKQQLVREAVALEERLAALSARAPKMPLIESVVASTDGDQIVGLAAGAEDGVERGFQFSIRRDKKIIARVVAHLVGARAVACRILIVKPGEKIQVGDWASTKLD